MKINENELSDSKKFPTLPKMFLHIILTFIPIYFITNIIILLIPYDDSARIAASWDTILPIVLGIFLLILTIIDLIFVYTNISRKAVVILIFSLICLLFLLYIIAFIMYGGVTIFTTPFIYFIISEIICTAFGFVTNIKC